MMIIALKRDIQYPGRYIPAGTVGVATEGNDYTFRHDDTLVSYTLDYIRQHIDWFNVSGYYTLPAPAPGLTRLQGDGHFCEPHLSTNNAKYAKRGRYGDRAVLSRVDRAQCTMYYMSQLAAELNSRHDWSYHIGLPYQILTYYYNLVCLGCYPWLTTVWVGLSSARTLS